MYVCPNCGGNLKFHIPSQQLFCAYCESKFDPYSIKKETDTEGDDSFEANVFSCPQCGGEMLSGDNDATAFCSYCGSANILSARISREKRPKYIIPFRKTKEDCKRAYERKMKKAFFVPRDFRNPDFVDGFRGIYMPYWVYHITQKGPINLVGKTSKRKGEYIYTDHYQLKGDLDAEYLGYASDASTAFYDNISEALAPYDSHEMKEFTPTFLSGFYADTADVEAEVYESNARQLSTETTYEKICRTHEFKAYEMDTNVSRQRREAQLFTESAGTESAMFPVWFMSYRNGDRVAYATVNGQTGKVVADMPVDEKKFFVCSLFLAIPIFLWLDVFLTLRPMVLLGWSAVLATFAAYLYSRELSKIVELEKVRNDVSEQKKKNKRANVKKSHDNGIVPLILFAFLCLFVAAVVESIAFVPWAVSVVGMTIICVTSVKKHKKIKKLKGGQGFLLAAGAVVIGVIIRILKPVSDLWYYGGVLLILASIIFILADLIRNYNRLAMRKLPQFDKKGGDDNA